MADRTKGFTATVETGDGAGPRDVKYCQGVPDNDPYKGSGNYLVDALIALDAFRATPEPTIRFGVTEEKS